MKSISEMCELLVNNEACVVLKFKSDMRMDMIATGLMSGDEDMYRVTKGKQQEHTIWYKDGHHWSWHHGCGSSTMVTDKVRERGAMIEKAIIWEYGISLGPYAYK